MSFRIEDDSVLIKYYEIWNKIKRTFVITSIASLYMIKKYMKTKVKTFNGVVYTIFWREKVPKKTYIKLKLSVMKMDKKSVFSLKCI